MLYYTNLYSNIHYILTENVYIYIAVFMKNIRFTRYIRDVFVLVSFAVYKQIYKL